MITCYAVYGTDLALTAEFPGLDARHASEVLMDLVTSPWDYEILAGKRLDLPDLVRVEFVIAEPGSWLAFDAESRLLGGAMATYGTDGKVDPAVWVDESPQPGHPRHRRASRAWEALYRAYGHERDGYVQDGSSWDYPTRYRRPDAEE